MRSPEYPKHEPHRDVGIYIHIPFCRRRCTYCGFASHSYDPDLMRDYIHAVMGEARARQGEALEILRESDSQVDTVYLGGGTPSLLDAEQLARLLSRFMSLFPVREGAELTMEVNPDSAERAKLGDFRRIGINRVSLGVQSLDDEELRSMGRVHTAAEAVAAYRTIRDAGFDNVSVDLIAGFPGQTRESFARTLDGVIGLKPEHVSIYMLELKAGTRLDADIRRGLIAEPDDDLAADLYEDICARLAESGYEHYEISNYCLPGRESRHNLKYWDDSVFLGFGAGAHGMTGTRRYANVEDVELYIGAIARGDSPMARNDAMSPEIRFKDSLIMGLRLVKGLDLGLLSRRYGIDAAEFVRDTIGDLIEAGLCSLRGDNLSLTPRGLLLSNLVFSRWV